MHVLCALNTNHLFSILCPLMKPTLLALADSLPLTCSRTGTCCHGKIVRINPWELARLAQSLSMSPRAFRDLHCLDGVLQIRFEGAHGWMNLPACNLYDPGKGCIAHTGRPLACRLYPLGRERQENRSRYMHPGREFPCLSGCPEVNDLPRMSVADYLAGQGVQIFEWAQDAYLEVMQDLAEWAFVLLLETGLAATEQKRILRRWHAMGYDAPSKAAQRLAVEWLDLLMLPEIPLQGENPESFLQIHSALLQTKARDAFASLTDPASIGHASVLMMGLALQLGRGLGADPASLVNRWMRSTQI